jgi:fructose-1,6-bisphosphatase/inositol monophosphatase family enzyme
MVQGTSTCSRLGYFESGLGRLDIAAGAAIVEAAGGRVVELRGGELPEPLLVAANPRLLKQLVHLVWVEAEAAGLAGPLPN